MAKRTEKAQGEPPSLTPKQQAYVNARLAGSNKSDAYRASYNVTNMTDKQVWEESCKLDAHPKVAQRLAALQEQAIAKVVLDRAWVLERLMRNADKGEQINDLTASNKALELLGKTDELQMFVERANVTSDNRHHHSAEPLSPFAQHLAEVLGAGAESPPEGSVPN